jgi:ABC-2 type transport system permease protein
MRIPVVVVQTFVFPVLLLLVLHIVFGEIVEEQFSDTEYADRIVPLMALSAALFGSLGSAAALVEERRLGLLDRMRAMPGPRAAPMAGRVLSDIVRVLVGSVLVAAAGHLVGFGFDAGPAAILAYFGLVVLYGSAFGWVVLAFAARARSTEQLAFLNTIFLVMLFLNTGFVPAESYPGFLQPVVRAAPHTAAVDALNGLSAGGEVLDPVLRTLGWILLITIVFAPLAVIRLDRPARGAG